MLGLSLLLAGSLIAQQPVQPVAITLGNSVVPLTGPWHFHTGDNPAWADPRLSDDSWETVDLTPSSPDAHDGDVGLVGWVNGWGARGHAGYTGFAWYRLRVRVTAGSLDTLALLGPLQVDDAYQLYIDGHLAGETGDFSGSPPIAYNTKPRLYALPPGSGTMLIALRVWTRPRTLLGDPSGGGIRIAPVLGQRAEIRERYDLQWLEKFNGYIVDCVEGLAFIPIAIMVLVLMRFDTADRGYWWLIAALLLIGARRENQAIFFWLPFESRPMFDIVTVTLLIPLMTGAWLMAWRGWFEVRRPSWLPAAIGVLTFLLMLAQYTHAATFAQIIRLACAAVLAVLTIAGVRQQGREGWLAVPLVILIAMALFPSEVTLLGIPGIWFPFGVGVSRTEYAIALFLLAMPALLVHRLFAFSPRTPALRLTGILLPLLFTYSAARPPESKAQWREDLRFLATELPERHVAPFHFLSKTAFDQEVARLDRTLDDLNPDEIFVGMDQIENSIGDGHTYIRVPDDAPIFPVHFERFGNEYRLVSTEDVPGARDALGGQLMEIGATPINRARDLVWTLTPADETPALRDVRATALLNDGLVLHGLRIIPNSDTVRYVVRTADGKDVTLEYHGESNQFRGAEITSILETGWLSAVAHPALYLQRPDDGFWCTYLSASETGYCDFRSYADLEHTAQALTDLVQHDHPRALIIDLRLNAGGDFDKGLAYVVNPIRGMSDINRAGHLFVLIGARTFSAAMANAAHFRARTKAILVGQPIGEKPNSYQEAREMTLPNSHWVARYSVRFYRFVNDTEDVIRPDHDIPETWADFQAGRDPVLDWVLHHHS